MMFIRWRLRKMLKKLIINITAFLLGAVCFAGVRSVMVTDSGALVYPSASTFASANGLTTATQAAQIAASVSATAAIPIASASNFMPATVSNLTLSTLTAANFGGDAFANALLSGRYSFVNVQTGTETISNAYIGNLYQGKAMQISSSSTLANRFSFVTATPIGRFGGALARYMNGTISGAAYFSVMPLEVKSQSGTALMLGMGTATASFDSSLTTSRAVFASITQSGTTTMTAQLFCTELSGGALTYATCSDPVSFRCATIANSWMTTQKLAFRTRTENGTSTAYLYYGYAAGAPALVLSGSYNAWTGTTSGGYFIGLYRASDTATQDAKVGAVECVIIDER